MDYIRLAKKLLANKYIKGLDRIGRLVLDQNNGTPLPYSELPQIIKSAISEDGDGVFNSLDINSNASIDSDGNATLNSITNNGYEEKNVKTLSGETSYNIQSSDSVILVKPPTQGVSITLPTPSDGKQLTIKDKSGSASLYNITINQNNTENIDGYDSYTIDTSRGSVTLISDGTDWFVISEVN